jgi:hypothetical protein
MREQCECDPTASTHLYTLCGHETFRTKGKDTDEMMKCDVFHMCTYLFRIEKSMGCLFNFIINAIQIPENHCEFYA